MCFQVVHCILICDPATLVQTAEGTFDLDVDTPAVVHWQMKVASVLDTLQDWTELGLCKLHFKLWASQDMLDASGVANLGPG